MFLLFLFSLFFQEQQWLIWPVPLCQITRPVGAVRSQLSNQSLQLAFIRILSFLTNSIKHHIYMAVCHTRLGFFQKSVFCLDHNRTVGLLDFTAPGTSTHVLAHMSSQGLSAPLYFNRQHRLMYLYGSGPLQIYLRSHCSQNLVQSVPGQQYSTF